MAASDSVRLEALSDGVFAIAITLLVLEIRLPADLAGPQALRDALIRLWPSYVAFVVSFITIGIMWMNHHALFSLLQRTSPRFVVMNLLLLMAISFIPFPSFVLARHLETPETRATATTFYSGCFFLCAICFNLLWRSAKATRILRQDVLPQIDGIDRAYYVGIIGYGSAVAISWFAPIAGVALSAALALYFVVVAARNRAG